MILTLEVYDSNGLTEETFTLPNFNNLNDLINIAKSFNGYWYCGGLIELRELYNSVNKLIINNNLDKVSLLDLRACLFYLFRSVRNNVQEFGDSAYDQEEMIKFVELIKVKLKSK